VKRWPIAVAALVLLSLGAAVVANLGGGSAHVGNGALPPVSQGIPTDYRVLYQVTTPSGIVYEEHIVHRPFDAEVVQRDANQKVTSERWSSLGLLVTRSPGSPAVSLQTAVAPSAGDERPDLFVDPLTKVHRLTPAGSTVVGGRACTESSQPDRVATDSGNTTLSQAGTLPVVVTSCVDAQGMVLQEQWRAASGDRVLLTKIAVELVIGKGVPALHVPNAQPLPDAQGNGSVHRIDPTQAVPFAETFHLPAPAGYTYLGRWSVVPARISASPGALAADAGIELYTDVWQRGPDILMLDQGVNKNGAPPFDPRSKLGPIVVPGVGLADLAVDLRLAEVRFTRLAGGFARLSGTLDPAALVRLADTITVQATAR
jgi:hypothetical protein